MDTESPQPDPTPTDTVPARSGTDPVASPDPCKKPLTARRLRRKIWRGFLFTFAGLLLVVFVLTRTGVTKSLLLPRLEAALGAEIDAGSIVVTPDLSVLLRRVSVRVPDVSGRAGEVFSADRLLVELDWRSIASVPTVSKIELESPLIRLSQDSETGDVNAVRLGIFSKPKSGKPLTIPTVVVRNGLVELGEHGFPAPAGDDYQVLAEFPISGVLAPQAGITKDRSFFSLTRRAGESGLEVTGFLDPKGVTFTLGGVNLNDWPAESIPTRFRDLWSRLQLDGRIIPRTIAISSTGDVAISADLDRVAITLPFTAEDARSDEPVRLTDVTGRLFVDDDRISADLTGRAESLEQRVQFDFFGFDARTSPFVARLITPRLRWERDIALLDYVPPQVINHVDRFGKPEADVEAVIWLARRLEEIPSGENAGVLARFRKPDDLLSDPDSPDAVRLSGTLAMRNGTAAFRGFPYTFNDLSVDFRFTTRQLLVENVDGVSPSGARLTGGGWAAPLGPTSAVDLSFVVTDAVIDDALLAALSPARRELVDVLFNNRVYAELVDEGLIRTPTQALPLNERLRAIETERVAWSAAGGIAPAELARLDAEEARVRAELDEAPEFALGGAARVDMRFIRQEGDISIWSRDISLDFPEIGFLTSMFAMPAIGRDVKVLIGEDDFVLKVDNGVAINGGEVTVDAYMDRSDEARAASPDGNTLPTVRVEVRGIPIDPLLIRAIGGPGSDGEARPGSFDLADLLTRLGLDGTVDADADLVPNGGNLDYTVRNTLRGLTADIAEARTHMVDASGSVVVTRDSVELDIAGDLVATESGARADDASIVAAITLPMGADWGNLRDEGEARSDSTVPPARPKIDATIMLPLADLAIPVEPIIGLFDSGAAATVADLRETYRPEGRLGVTTTIRGTLGTGFGDSADVNVALSDLDRLDFDYQGLRLTATESAGHAIVLLGGRPRIAFDDFSVDLATNRSGGRDPAGRLSILDTVAIGDAFDTSPLAITLEAGRFESPLTIKSIEQVTTLADLAETYRPVGLFDLNLRRNDSGDYSGTASPRSITVTTPRGDLVFPSASGTVAFGPDAGRFEGISLASPLSTVSVDGDWENGEDGSRLALQIGAETEGLPDGLVGLAPVEIGEVFDALELKVAGPTKIERLDVAMRVLPDGEIAEVTTAGTVGVSDASLMIGIPATEIAGTITFEATRPDPTAEPRFTLGIDAQRGRLMGLRVTNAVARVLSGTEPGSVLVPSFGADSHGGRVTAAVRINPPGGPTAESPQPYWADLQLAEVRIAPLLEDVRVSPNSSLADEIRADIVETSNESVADEIWDNSSDRTRGLLSASLSISGVVGTPEGRRGRGRIIAGGGSILQFPLLTRLIEVANLQLPIGEELGLAYANLFLEGDRVVMEDVAVLSGRVELLGAGELTLPDGELDFRVRSRAINRIPVLTEVIESLRDELISTRVSGTIAEPVITPVTLEETRRVLGSLMGRGSATDQLRSISTSREGARQRIRQAGALLHRSGAGGAAPTRVGDNDAP